MAGDREKLLEVASLLPANASEVRDHILTCIDAIRAGQSFDRQELIQRLVRADEMLFAHARAVGNTALYCAGMLTDED